MQKKRKKKKRKVFLSVSDSFYMQIIISDSGKLTTVTWHSCVTSHLNLPTKIENVTTRRWQQLQNNHQHLGAKKGFRTSKCQLKTSTKMTSFCSKTRRIFSNSVLVIPINSYIFSSVSWLSLGLIFSLMSYFENVKHRKVKKNYVIPIPTTLIQQLPFCCTFFITHPSMYTSIYPSINLIFLVHSKVSCRHQDIPFLNN